MIESSTRMRNGGADRPISALWKAPPAYVENILSFIRLLESAVVQRAVERVFRPAVVSAVPMETLNEVLSHRRRFRRRRFRPEALW